MELVPSFTLYLAYSIIISVIIYLVGDTILSFWKKGSTTDLELFFKKMTIGVILITVSYATYKAHFNTILSGVWVVSGIYIYWNKQKISKFALNNFKYIEWKPVIFYLTGLLFLMTFFYFRAVSINGTPRLVFIDNPYYAGIADLMNKYGVETNSFNPFSIKSQSPAFYHFFNEWFMAFIAKVFSITSLSAYSFIALPVLWSIVFTGAAWISYQFMNKNVIFHWFLSISFFFILGLGKYLQHLFFIDMGITFWDMNILNVGLTKLAIACILIITAATNLKENTLTIHFYYPFALLSILYITFFPSIFGGTLIYYILQKSHKKKVNTHGIILIFISTLFIVSFYLFNSFFYDHTYENHGLIKQFIEYLKSDELSIKPYIITIYATFFRFFVASIPYIILLFISKKRLKAFITFNNSLLIYLLSILLTAYIGYTFLVFSTDSSQILSNPAISIYIIITYTTLCYIISTVKKYDWPILIIIIIFMITNIYQTYPEGGNWNLKKLDIIYWRKLENEFKGKEFSSAYLNKEKKKRLYNHNLHIPYLNLRYITTSYYPVPLGIFEMPAYQNLKEKATDIRTKTKSEFYRFVKQNNLANNVDSAKYLFLKQYKIDYLFVEKGNKWFEQAKDKLPIDYYIKDLNQSFTIAKLKW